MDLDWNIIFLGFTKELLSKSLESLCASIVCTHQKSQGLAKGLRNSGRCQFRHLAIFSTRTLTCIKTKIATIPPLHLRTSFGKSKTRVDAMRNILPSPRLCTNSATKGCMGVNNPEGSLRPSRNERRGDPQGTKCQDLYLPKCGFDCELGDDCQRSHPPPETNVDLWLRKV